MGKKALCLIFAFLLSLNSFAAAVSDNDGSAFITKAEFDSLKNKFQSQLDAYNTSIDSKIDYAIAGYIAGLKVEKVSSGDNYIARIGDVRFYSLSKTLNTTSVDNIRYGYMVRAFGSISPIDTKNLYNQRHMMGSWLYSSDGTHSRSGILNYGGAVNNYFYEVEDVEIGGLIYKTLVDTTSKNIIHYFGAYGSCWDSTRQSNLVENVTMEPYNLDLSTYDTNMVEPWSYDWSQLGATMTAKGQKFNVWSKYDNETDDLRGYYYFNNKRNDPNITINTFTTYDFNNFSITKQFNCAEWYGQDTWFSTHDAVTSTDTVQDWHYRRVYTGNGTWHDGDIGYKKEGKVEDSWISYTKGTPWIKYRMPKFVEKKSGHLINSAASKLLKTDIYPWSGVPLTQMKAKTIKLEIELTVEAFDNSTDVKRSNKPYYILIHRDKFPNNSTDNLLTLLPQDDYISWYINDGKTNIKLTIDESTLSKWKDNDYLYMRAYAEDNTCYAKVKCNSILFTSKDD